MTVPFSVGQIPIILASKSPRRIELMQQAGLQFTVQLSGETIECWPNGMQREEIPLYLARLKADIFTAAVTISPETVVITADTVVWLNGHVLGKPADRAEAVEMLTTLSGRKHTVFTGVCLTRNGMQKTFHAESSVFFRPLETAEIAFYVDTFHPMDKAGAYGIQEWIGCVGIERIEGSYSNVMGLPMAELYRELVQMAGEM